MDPESNVKKELVIAEAKLRVGLVLFGCAVVVTIAGLYLTSSVGPQPWCGVQGSFNDIITVPRLAPDSLLLTTLQLGATEKAGEKLFKGECASCHKLDKDMSGPALTGWTDRHPERSMLWLNRFLSDRDTLFQLHDPSRRAIREDSMWSYSRWNHGVHGLDSLETSSLVLYIGR